jgi:hypothetical protein
MLNGFGGWARFPWAAYVAPSGNILMAASPGAFKFTGLSETFAVSAADGKGVFSLTGTSTALGFSSKASPGAFSFAGMPAVFVVTEADHAGGFVLTGVATADMIGERINPNGSFTIAGISAEFHVAANDQAGFFTQSGISQALTRDFINWVNRPFGAGSWADEEPPSLSWSAAGSQASSWNNDTASVPEWSPLAPPSQSWTIDPAQQILPPVSE